MIAKIRPITWVWVGVNVVVLILLLLGGGGVIGACLPPEDLLDCLSSIGKTYILWTIWLPVNIGLAAIWIITRFTSPRCPKCQSFLRSGQVECPGCGEPRGGAPSRPRATEIESRFSGLRDDQQTHHRQRPRRPPSDDGYGSI